MGSVVKSVVGGVGRALGIGAGNTPTFDPSRFAYNPKESAFAATNQEQLDDLKRLQAESHERMQGIDEREARAKQTSLAAALEAASRGEGDSLAQNQLRQATDRNLAQQLSLAAAARGNTNPALMQRQLLNNQAAINQAASAQSADLRLQEQQQARQQLAQVLDSQRGQDQNAFAQQMGAQMSAIDAQQGINDANRNAQMALEQMRAGIATNQMAHYAADVQSRRQAQNNIVGGLIQGTASAAAALSDKETKKDIKPGRSDISKFLDALEAKRFKYKNPNKHGKGERLGIMAQDAEDGGILGKTIVSEGPDGKYLDMTKGFGAILAAQAELHKRLKDLEGNRKK